MEPGNASLRGSLGMALKDHFQFEEALVLFEQLKTENPNEPFPWRQIGFVYGYLVRPEAAISAYEQSLKLDPKQPKVWRALMESYHTAGRQEDVKRGLSETPGPRSVVGGAGLSGINSSVWDDAMRWRPIIFLVLCAAPAQAGEAERVFEGARDSVVTVTTLDERGQIDGEGSGVVVAPPAWW